MFFFLNLAKIIEAIIIEKLLDTFVVALYRLLYLRIECVIRKANLEKCVNDIVWYFMAIR